MAKKDYNLSKTQTEAPAADTRTPEQAAAATSLAMTIAAPAEMDFSKLKRRGMPTLIKPGDVPVNSVIAATIEEILPSPVSTVKGFLMRLKHTNGTEFCFPVTGVVRNALAPGVREDDKALKTALDKEIGKQLVLRRLADKPSKFKKSMFVFDVFTS